MVGGLDFVLPWENEVWHHSVDSLGHPFFLVNKYPSEIQLSMVVFCQIPMLKNVSKETAHCVDFKSTLTRTTHICWENICFRANFPFYCSNEFLLRGYHSLGNQSGIETCSPRSTRKLPAFPLQSLSWKTNMQLGWWLSQLPEKPESHVASFLGIGEIHQSPHPKSTGCITPMGWIHKPALQPLLLLNSTKLTDEKIWGCHGVSQIYPCLPWYYLYYLYSSPCLPW